MINIAIMGYGVVGSGVAEVCQMNQAIMKQRTGYQIKIKKILDIRDFPDDPFGDRITHNPDDIFSDPDISIVVETIGGTSIAYKLSVQALKAGKHLITSNKELVAAHGPELMALARKKNVNYFFEASVGGGIPIIRPLHKSLAANEIRLIAGILNGTTNYILTRMDEAGITFEQALSEAQSKGYAEQDPTEDLNGSDACRKLAILASITTGQYVDYRKIYSEGITNILSTDLLYAHSLNMKLKLISRFKLLPDHRADMIVAPMLIGRNHPIAAADDVNNAILIEGNALGEAMFYGQGAGKLPTASAVVADIISCAMHLDRVRYLSEWVIPKQEILRDHGECSVQALVRFSNGLSAAQVRQVFDVYGAKPVKAQAQNEHAWLIGIASKLTEQQLASHISSFGEQVLSRIRLY
ncbi:MAG: homoserine dehydrogenase [Clostridiaceae bacterium]|nr:homoserine dehydrogenase [Clostridiaceae bacterium]